MLVSHNPKSRAKRAKSQARGLPAIYSPTSRPWYELRNPRRLLSLEAYKKTKRMFDLTICIILLPIVLPTILILGMIIKLESPGPIFFCQKRTGRGGRSFRMFKLRTMVKNAEELKKKYQHLNALSYPDFKIKEDPRVTRLGRFLRKTSLDEMPQLFNVLRGEMSLVGPRPTSFGPKYYQTWHTERLEAVPGITGLWQVSGRNDLQFDERLRLDIAYIRNQSLYLDLRILLRTITCVITRAGAH